MKSNHLPSSRVGSRAALLWACVALAYCKLKYEPPEGQCLFNSDCPASSICAGRYCRATCNDRDAATAAERNRDCPAGWQCLPSGQEGRRVCLPPGVFGYCVYSSDCTSPFVCTRDGRCSPQCREARDCYTISLDPSSTCVFTDDIGTCSFRDAGGTPPPTDATSPVDGG